MDERELKRLINQKENSNIELSNCTTEITDSVFQLICALLNKEGGSIVLGVHDFGKIIGISDVFLDNMLHKLTETFRKEFAPSVDIVPEVINIDRKNIIYLNIPQSPQVHKYRNKVYDRLGDEITDVTYTYNLVENIYLRKKKESSENIVFPFLRVTELDDVAFRTMRKCISMRKPNHPWLDLSNEDMLHAAGFWRKDPLSNKEGFVLATVLLFGKEVTIQNYCPVVHRTDAIFRNIKYEDFLKPSSNYPESRYDDRDIIFSNLIDTYSRLMGFVERHLPERVIKQRGKTIDIRKTIFGELLTNMLVHREYTHKYPSRLSIFTDKVITENGTRLAQSGNVTFDTLEPNTKNPLITKVFQEMGWISELGSGKNNIQNFAAYYDKTYEVNVQNSEKFIFSISYGNEGLDENEIIPAKTVQSSVAEAAKRQIEISPQRMYNGFPMYDSKLYDACPGIDISYIEKAESILEACVKPRQIQEMMQMVKQSNRTRFRQNIIRPLIDEGLLAMRIPTKPSSPLQKYFTTEKGKALL